MKKSKLMLVCFFRGEDATYMSCHSFEMSLLFYTHLYLFSSGFLLIILMQKDTLGRVRSEQLFSSYFVIVLVSCLLVENIEKFQCI